MLRTHFRKPVIILSVALLLMPACSDSEATSDTTTTTVAKPEATTVEETLALGRPVVLAHASGENIHPHSTPFGYADAVDQGVDILDFDLQMTKDGVLIVHHDDTIDRTTNSTGKVADLTYAELLELDNAYWFTVNCTCADQPEADYIYRGVRTGEKEAPAGYTAEDFIIAKFEDLVNQYPNHLLNIEIKGEYPAAVPAAKELARILTETNSLDRAVVTSFDDQVVDEFRSRRPGGPVRGRWGKAAAPGAALDHGLVLPRQSDVGVKKDVLHRNVNLGDLHGHHGNIDSDGRGAAHGAVAGLGAGAQQREQKQQAAHGTIR
jgi:glycerophosphoryl diester phosphodiesterase